MAQPKPFATLKDKGGTWKLFVMYDEGARAYYGQVHAPLGHIAIVSDYFDDPVRVALHTSRLLKDHLERRDHGRHR